MNLNAKEERERFREEKGMDLGGGKALKGCRVELVPCCGVASGGGKVWRWCGAWVKGGSVNKKSLTEGEKHFILSL